MQAHAERDGPYRVAGFNYTDLDVYNFVVDGFGDGSVHARQFGGGGGMACCIAVPKLPTKRDGYIAFHFLPDRKIEAQWVEYPTGPRNPNTTSNASSTTNSMTGTSTC
ncbi:hypothetical protein WS75_18420 [Burkholderia sp. FL-7-2-10-S1-D7]|nr:DUF3304 domain-containing protein [Burkholderia sp. FL-7-2-10-S1-D7]KVF73197.1 hypothetical protein WS75_18420 [Burkholderia sp. FL-7-2-10-S1-D7]